MIDVLVAGEIYVDLIMAGFNFLPKPGEEAFAREFRREIGGGAAITACGLASLGTPTGLFAVAGADHHAWIASRLAEFGVDTASLSAVSAEPTGFTVAVTTPQDRTFFSYLGANREFPAAIAGADFHGARHVHLAWSPPWEIAPALFQRIHQSGATVSLDAGWHEDWLSDARALPALREVDLFFPNETEGARITGKQDPAQIVEHFSKAGLRGVALKLGAAGSRLLLDGQTYLGPPRPASPIDTTGAGDCFDAGFLHAWLHKQSPHRCLELANLCGALSTEAYGGIAGFPSRERIRKEWST